jgi:hypothetical protein
MPICYLIFLPLGWQRKDVAGETQIRLDFKHARLAASDHIERGLGSCYPDMVMIRFIGPHCSAVKGFILVASCMIRDIYTYDVQYNVNSSHTPYCKEIQSLWV